MTYGEGAISLPEGYRALALYPEDRGAALSICLITRFGSVTGTPFVLLRETTDASIYLGCLVDGTGDPKAWLEIWVQNTDRMAQSFQAPIEAINNSLVDRRWPERLTMFRSLNRSALIETGWETVHPPPAFFDPSACAIIHPLEPLTNRPFVLCTDDAALTSAGLPAYTSSIHRYLWTGGEAPIFVATTAGAPTPAGVQSGPEAFPNLLPLNPGGGFLLVRSLFPLKLVEFADLLAGKSWPGFSSGGTSLNLGKAYSQLGDVEMLVQDGAHLFSGRSGGVNQLREIFHLKLNLVFQTLTQIRDAIRSQQLPFLNLNTESFRVGLSETGTGLPCLWTARVELVESSAGVPLTVPTSESRYFIPPVIPGPSIYRPQTSTALTYGQGTLRIRKLLPPVPEGISIEATLATDERLELATSDLIHVRLGLPIGRVDLYGHADESSALAKGETRIRTLPQKLGDDAVTALDQAAGTPVTMTHFEILPLLASPYDMYAAAVLAARILLVDAENTLAIAVDELLSLAREVAARHGEGGSFAGRLHATIDKDPRWGLSLGPHRLTFRPGLRSMARLAIPSELWWQTLGIILRLFPGAGPDSFCRDFGDAPSLALDGIFEKPLAELELLQLRSRSLVVTDWNQNLEIRDAIGAAMAKIGLEPKHQGYDETPVPSPRRNPSQRKRLP
jgi:hypothetical protein